MNPEDEIRSLLQTFHDGYTCREVTQDVLQLPQLISLIRVGNRSSRRVAEKFTSYETRY